MHSQQSWDTVLPNSISSSLFSWSSLFQRQVQNNFLSFLFLSAFFARAKHWVHLKPWHRILPVEEITPLFLWMPLNLRCHKIASRTCFETVFPLPLLSVRITYSTFWGRKTWHFALLFDRYEEHTYEEIRQLDLVLHSDGNDNFFIYNNLMGLNCVVKQYTVKCKHFSALFFGGERTPVPLSLPQCRAL